MDDTVPQLCHLGRSVGGRQFSRTTWTESRSAIRLKASSSATKLDQGQCSSGSRWVADGGSQLDARGRFEAAWSIRVVRVPAACRALSARRLAMVLRSTSVAGRRCSLWSSRLKAAIYARSPAPLRATKGLGLSELW
jgi:hypothetical protein